jgi:aconitate hydratase
MEGTNRQTLNITGDEVLDIIGLDDLAPRKIMTLAIHRSNGTIDHVPLLCRIDTADEVNYYQHGGILHYVLREMASGAA